MLGPGAGGTPGSRAGVGGDARSRVGGMRYLAAAPGSAPAPGWPHRRAPHGCGGSGAPRPPRPPEPRRGKEEEEKEEEVEEEEPEEGQRCRSAPRRALRLPSTAPRPGTPPGCPKTLRRRDPARTQHRSLQGPISMQHPSPQRPPGNAASPNHSTHLPGDLPHHTASPNHSAHPLGTAPPAHGTP